MQVVWVTYGTATARIVVGALIAITAVLLSASLVRMRRTRFRTSGPGAAVALSLFGVATFLAASLPMLVSNDKELGGFVGLGAFQLAWTESPFVVAWLLGAFGAIVLFGTARQDGQGSESRRLTVAAFVAAAFLFAVTALVTQVPVTVA